MENITRTIDAKISDIGFSIEDKNDAYIRYIRPCSKYAEYVLIDNTNFVIAVYTRNYAYGGFFGQAEMSGLKPSELEVFVEKSKELGWYE